MRPGGFSPAASPAEYPTVRVDPAHDDELAVHGRVRIERTETGLPFLAVEADGHLIEILIEEELS